MQKIDVNLLPFQSYLKIQEIEGRNYLWDRFRKKYILVQPEELVRQLLLIYLIEKKEFPPLRIALEKTLIINQRRKRFDALIYDDKFQPMLLIECKAPDVNINFETIAQIANYNSILKVPFLILSNGIKTYFMQWEEASEQFIYLAELPFYKDLLTTYNSLP